MGEHILTGKIMIRISKSIILSVIEKIRSKPPKPSFSEKMEQQIIMLSRYRGILVNIIMNVKQRFIAEFAWFGIANGEIVDERVDSRGDDIGIVFKIIVRIEKTGLF
jgi:hypothetical protein